MTLLSRLCAFVLFTVSYMGFICGSVCAQDVVIENVTVISPDQKSPKSGQYVWLQGGMIKAVSDRPFTKVTQAGAKKIDGQGLYLTPGLMDSHVHINSIPGIGFMHSDMADKHKKLVDIYLAQQPRSYLYHGVTQILNLGSSRYDDRFKSIKQRPDYYTCQQVPGIEGYPNFDPDYTMGNVPTFVLEDDYKGPLPEGVKREDHTPEAVVARIAQTDARCVKIYIEDGFGAAHDWPVFSDGIIKRLKQAAAKHGLPLVAHANAVDMHRIALRGGVDVMAHGMWNWNWPKDKGPVPLEDTLQQIITNKVGYMPSIQVMQTLGALFDPAVLESTSFKKVVPAEMLSWFKTEDAQWFKKELLEEYPKDTPDAQMVKIFGYGVGRGMRVAKALSDMGHPLLVGSDLPSSPTYAGQPGLNTYQEMVMMAKAGISLRAVFEAATIHNARQFGLDQKYGTVTAGKVANLLLLKANPLEDITAWDQIDRVILKGTVIDRARLVAP